MSADINVTNSVGHTNSANLTYVISLQAETNNEESLDNENENKILDPRYKGGVIYSLFSFVIVAFCAICVVPWTTIARTNSNYYQSHWMEVNVPMAFNLFCLP